MVDVYSWKGPCRAGVVLAEENRAERVQSEEMADSEAVEEGGAGGGGME